jgi:hypothetical protein
MLIDISCGCNECFVQNMPTFIVFTNLVYLSPNLRIKIASFDLSRTQILDLSRKKESMRCLKFRIVEIDLPIRRTKSPKAELPEG